MGATRINRIYTTQKMIDRKIGVETVAATFTDHLAVVLRLTVDIPILRRGRGIWKMNAAFVEENMQGEVAPTMGRLEKTSGYSLKRPCGGDGT
jgi:hypothetical protein